MNKKGLVYLDYDKPKPQDPTYDPKVQLGIFLTIQFIPKKPLPKVINQEFAFYGFKN